MMEDSSPNTDPNGDPYLSPVPDRRAPACAFLHQVPGKRNVKTQALEHPNHRRVRRSHATPPSSSRSPPQSRIKLCLVSRTFSKPVGVIRKYRLALPPLSGVGSPKSERSKPFS